MAQEETIKLFEGKQVRFVWDDEKQKYYFSVVDIIQVLTERLPSGAQLLEGSQKPSG